MIRREFPGRDRQEYGEKGSAHLICPKCGRSHFREAAVAENVRQWCAYGCREVLWFAVREGADRKEKESVDMPEGGR